MRRAAVLTLLVCFATAAPASAQMRQFRDWVAACDNLRSCAAYGIPDSWSIGYLRITRDGAPDARPVVTLAIHQGERTRFSLAFDRPVSGILPSGTVQPDAVEEDDYMRIAIDAPMESLVTALRTATKIIITPVDPPGPGPHYDSEVPFAGAIEALAWIDQQQQRTGTVTALIKRGSKPASAVPAAPAAPLIAAAKPDPDPPPAGHPPVIVAKGRAACGKQERNPEPRDMHRLGSNLLMYWFFCPAYSGAYNLNHALLLVLESDLSRSRLAVLTYPPHVARIEKRKTDAPYDASFDTRTMTLTLLYLRRAAADCGTQSEWVWDGSAFKLTLFRKMPVCGGSRLDWPILYRAKVAASAP